MAAAVLDHGSGRTAQRGRILAARYLSQNPQCRQPFCVLKYASPASRGNPGCDALFCPPPTALAIQPAGPVICSCRTIQGQLSECQDCRAALLNPCKSQQHMRTPPLHQTCSKQNHQRHPPPAHQRQSCSSVGVFVSAGPPLPLSPACSLSIAVASQSSRRRLQLIAGMPLGSEPATCIMNEQSRTAATLLETRPPLLPCFKCQPDSTQHMGQGCRNV